MLVLGLILISIAAALLIGALISGSNDTAQLDIGVFSGETSSMVVFLAGAATVLIFVMGLEMVRSGVRRANRRRKQKKEYHNLSERYGKETDTKQDSGTPDPG